MSDAPENRTRRRFLPGADVLVLVALLLLFAALSFGIAGQNEPPQDPFGTNVRSSYSTDAGGWKAYYRLLELRGNRVSRVQRRPREWPAKAGVVITGPYSVGGAAGQWSEAEAQDALDWVSDGGILIAFTDAADDLTSALGVRMTEKKPLDLLGLDAADKEKTAKTDTEQPSLTPAEVMPKAANTPLSVRQPALFLQGITDLSIPGDKRYTAIPRQSIVLMGDKLPVTIVIPYGKGSVLAVSDAGIADNTQLVKADNARFVTQMAEAYASRERPTILFDEYHQGYRNTDTFWTAVGRPGQLAFWQLTALFLLMAYSASRRFGLACPLPAPPRVSSEYVASLADLYRRARAADAALESVHRVFWRDLCRIAGMGTDAPLRAVAIRAAADAGISDESERTALAERITTTLTECRAKIEAADAPVEVAKVNDTSRKKKKRVSKPVFSEADLLRLVTAIEELRKELDLGGKHPV